jgi:hypothetical protein
VEKGHRAEISTAVPADLDRPDSSDTYNFVIDGGKLVKIALSVNDVAEVMKTYGKPTNDTVTPHEGVSGAKWENRQCVWDTPAGFITLDTDNNPRLQDHRPLLVLESREEHARAPIPTETGNIATALNRYCSATTFCGRCSIAQRRAVAKHDNSIYVAAIAKVKSLEHRTKAIAYCSGILMLAARFLSALL